MRPWSDIRGLGRPINDIDRYNRYHTGNSRSRFPNAISDHLGTPLMCKERNMIAFMGEITDKPGWTDKIQNEAIVDKWRAERAELEKTAKTEEALTEDMFDYCLEELQDYAKQLQRSGFVPAIDSDTTVYKSDSCIPEQLRVDLIAAAAPLEDVPADEKDWHPDSNEQVLDLVHPSLFPLLYGRSRAVADRSITLDECDKYIGQGDVVPVPDENSTKVEHFSGRHSWYGPDKQHFYSSKFQWLPSEVAFGNDDTATITSYINNLHPKFYKPLYQVIEQVIARTVPVWDATLSASVTRQSSHPRIDIEQPEYIEPTGFQPPEDEGVDVDEYYEDWYRENRTLVMPEPGQYAQRVAAKVKCESRPVHLRKDFEKHGLQIIVKLANIHLTPEKPDYAGGSWHIEGQLNEHICASALYYYSSENITDSHLDFREPTDIDHLQEKFYEQGDFEHFERLYGIRDQTPAIQVLGHVKTKQGRLVTFPNVLQHKVEPFELIDQTRAGHRKILALFLVDPYTPIPSTAHVPPQQKNWWRAMVHDLDRVANLPAEIAEQIVESGGDLIELQEAKSLRLELMAERKVSVEQVDERFRQETFGFCEH